MSEGRAVRSESRRRGALALALCVSAASFAAASARAELQGEQAGVASLPPLGDHWVWVSDRLIQHNILFDGDSGEVLGMIDSPTILTPKLPLVSRERNEIYSTDIAYSRGTRGERIDFISIYDLRTLAYRGEIIVPSMFGTSNASYPYNDMIGERFLGVFNQFPNASISIVDLVEREFVEEIIVTGCAGVYPVGARRAGVVANRFATLCGNGTVLEVTLDDAGRKQSAVSSERFFDVVTDPVFMAAGWDGSGWVFVSFEGKVHRVDFSGPVPVAEAAWSLLGGGDSGWRPGGLQHVAVHAGLGRLYVAMHEGGPGSHKDAGPEVWSFDLADKKRLQRIELPNLTASFLAGMLKVPEDSFVHSLMEWLLPDEGVHSLTVSQDDEPLLFMRNAMLGAVAVVDAQTGETLRVLTETGLAGPTLGVP